VHPANGALGPAHHGGQIEAGCYVASLSFQRSGVDLADGRADCVLCPSHDGSAVRYLSGLPMQRLSAAARGYDSRWARARLAYLAHNPLCVMCGEGGRVEPASVVDHRTPHRGNQQLFWAESNWQALCRFCHDKHKKKQEHFGYDVACGNDGWPIDPNHPVNKK
jgi:5-methylcytosine-specific restriction protein A